MRGVTAESTDCLSSSPPALSRPVLSLEEPQGRQMHLPEIHTQEPDAYLPPSPRFYRNTACGTHTHTSVYLHSLQQNTSVILYSTSQKFEFKISSSGGVN